MNDSWWRIQNLLLSLYEGLLRLYPPHFRREFSAEIRAIFLNRLGEAEDRGELAWLSSAFQEITGLIISLLREHWHIHRTRKEKTMAQEDQSQKDPGPETAGPGGGGMPALQPAGTPGMLWLTVWTLLITAAIPATWVIMAPLSVLFLGLINVGVKAGFWPAATITYSGVLGLFTGLALALALVQWVLLRKFLPRAGLWFLTTVAGVLLGGLAVGLILVRSSVQNWDPFWITAVVLLPLGLALGLAQWLYLRRFLPNAFWIILIDILAAGSILLSGGTYTGLADLVVLILPGVISGAGLWLLLRRSHPELPGQVRRDARVEKRRRFPRLAWIGMAVVALVPLFFACIWVYAASQLALAKNAGVYPTVEEAIIENNREGWGGASVVRIENVHASPNSRNKQPHVWFGGATVTLDRVPEGHKWDSYEGGSYYLRVRDGWVHMGEGAMPEFIGWVMELYNMEGVR